jgi:branched-chain amino acid transport system permease protein
MSGQPASAARRTAGRLGVAALGAVALLVPAAVDNQFGLYLLDMALINSVIALGLNVVLKTGQVSMAHAGFMAIGAYASAQLTVKLGLPFLAGFAAAGIAAALVALVLGRVILRLRGVYFRARAAALEGGVLLPGARRARAGGRVRVGALPLAVRPRDGRGARLGGPGRGHRLQSDAHQDHRVLDRMPAGGPGRQPLRAFPAIAPFSFTFWESVNFLLMNIVGGTTSLAGPILGALILTPLPELLRAYVTWQQVLYGLTFMLFMRFLPDGVTSLLAPARQVLAARFGGLAAEAPAGASDPRTGS